MHYELWGADDNATFRGKYGGVMDKGEMELLTADPKFEP